MVKVELRMPNREGTGWRTAATISAEGERYKVVGDAKLVDLSLPVFDRRAGRKLLFAEDREEWVRHLPSAYHAPDLVAVVVEDTNPSPTPPTPARERVVTGPASAPPRCPRCGSQRIHECGALGERFDVEALVAGRDGQICAELRSGQPDEGSAAEEYRCGECDYSDAHPAAFWPGDDPGPAEVSR